MCVSAGRTGENKAGKMMEKEVFLLNWQGGGKKSKELTKMVFIKK